ncbi:hypothetical protein E4J66_12450 [Actinomyces viscosus]|uniref:Lipocalin-like domain-containing protein n=1 Tax=Actinomyces viscosus TaxID=1656 RepID=A0A3S4VEV3_ACTVI|nr:hypothetical protein [Actinomyces viscosus]TFH51340.1 hypothetical protein E4J66_12450 [Actinomyces viscosus]VEI17044.1 Uncharacterised protein [Actinomyces viscosus]
MRQQIQFLSRALGRRETVKYLSIAAVGAVIAPLTGCSGSTLAFKKFAVGTWKISFSEADAKYSDWTGVELTVNENGRWTFKTDPYDGHRGESTGGTWSFSGGEVKVMETGEDSEGNRYGDIFFNAPNEGKYASIASGIPETVDTSKLPASFEWSYDTVDSFTVPMKWNEKTQALTLTATSRQGGTFSIIAIKQKK